MLKYTSKLAALSVLAFGLAVSSANAQLHFSFNENVNTGEVEVSISGSFAFSDFNVSMPDYSEEYQGAVSFSEGGYGFMSLQGEVNLYGFAGVEVSGNRPLAEVYLSISEAEWSGGVISSLVFTPSSNLLTLVTAATAEPGTFVADFSFVSPQSLAEIGLTLGESGELTFSRIDTGASIFSLTWSVGQIPEPSTYAAILGISVVGIALVRRRRK